MPDGELKDAWLSLPREEKGYTYDTHVNKMLQFELRVSVAACGCVGGQGRVWFELPQTGQGTEGSKWSPTLNRRCPSSDEKVANRNVRESGG
jgi:hypothetical protein